MSGPTVEVFTVTDATFQNLVNVVLSAHMPPKDAMQASPDLIYAGPKAYRALKWEFEGRRVWAGRDWRRLKRERRKYMNAA